MESRNILQMIGFTQEKMKKVNLFNTPRLFCDIYCFETGQEQKPHVHEGEDKVYLVLEGEGRFTVGGEVKTLSRYMTTLAPAGIEHGVRNEGPNRLVLLVYMSPNSHFHGDSPSSHGHGHGHHH